MAAIIDKALEEGACLTFACDAIGIHLRTYRRWKEDPVDRRKGSQKANSTALREQERPHVLEVCTSSKYRDIAPTEIVTGLAEEGVYIASARPFYRVLRSAGMLNHRGNDHLARTLYIPPEFKATGPVDDWSCEIVG
ncbi:hypothetical protein [Spirochaeta cellobiosiphila]|uniref:hypothetical protein n=1 Tax=Spirochaeta cellobiosiphila TaxID=504483 RepID=UPI000400A8D1|nr:hypothetical protein [Spirochaeta cellobiosiphila]